VTKGREIVFFLVNTGEYCRMAGWAMGNMRGKRRNVVVFSRRRKTVPPSIDLSYNEACQGSTPGDGTKTRIVGLF